MMIHQQHNLYASASRTAEIMSRYRPIAPKPEGSPESGGDSPVMSEKIKQSPYLRSIWAQLQARPTRTRKRGRMALSPTSFKRSGSSSSARIAGLLPSPPYGNSIAKNLSLHGFSSVVPGMGLVRAGTVDGLRPITTTTECLVTLPLLPGNHQLQQPNPPEVIDLNKEADHEENDSHHHLALQLKPCTAAAATVISPQPIKPIGSTINIVGCIINVENDVAPSPPEIVLKKPDEVEEEVESEALPAVISDSKNQVRLANSAYKKMVGQPECSWLDSMCACNRISGEVMLRISDGSGLPVSGNGFSCWVNIEYGNSKKKDSVAAYCDVMRLSCSSKDYLLTWKFHTQAPPEEGSNSSSSMSSSSTN